MKKLIALLVLLVLTSASAFGQTGSGFGVRVGGTAALLRGDDVGVTGNTTDRSLGFTIGAYKAIPLGGGFSLMPEVMYTQKGGQLSLDAFELNDEIASQLDLTFNVDYIEVPVTLGYTVLTQSRYTPMLYAGPYVSVATRRNVDFDMDGDGFSIDGDDFFKRADYGAVFGADLGIGLKRRTATVGIRYDLGIADIAKDDDLSGEPEGAIAPDVRNDEWSVLVGLRF